MLVEHVNTLKDSNTMQEYILSLKFGQLVRWHESVVRAMMEIFVTGH
jgi:hypothetical protein